MSSAKPSLTILGAAKQQAQNSNIDASKVPDKGAEKITEKVAESKSPSHSNRPEHERANLDEGAKNRSVPELATGRLGSFRGSLWSQICGRISNIYSEMYSEFRGGFGLGIKAKQVCSNPAFVKKFEVICAVVPGLLFIFSGISLLLAPDALPYLIAAFCISFGSLFCVLSLKLLKLKRKFSKFSHQIEARLIIDPNKVTELKPDVLSDHKKIVVH